MKLIAILLFVFIGVTESYSQVRLDISAVSSYLNESLPGNTTVRFTQVHGGAGIDFSQLVKVTNFVNIGYKVGYTFYGKLNIEGVDHVNNVFNDYLSSQAMHFMAIVHYRLYKNIRVEFGGGVAYQWNKITVSQPIIINSQSVTFPDQAGNYSSFRPITEIGGYYRFKKGLSAGLSYRHIFGDKIAGPGFTGDSVGIDSVAVTLRYRF
ncbi:hypothetical protein ACR9PT_10735 [Piscirickettsia salmonis]|uniref:hypothetical protein n=1 Tax=Piscirickettsia salmonis TaxID=1238 RepID=UPI0012BA68ED|nr:hypothetical protein [Piscirickettsia salmonis]QGP52718.1 hypothetical protein PsalSR1_00103 [Piscirickettsia salmonis]QGP57581.1 hypothetical protein PsalBI1_00113 [Piscirickettsia salmonis]QGP62286.1 hypothetical protein PsalMR5_00103 [Piscirickettsia salmonis]